MRPGPPAPARGPMPFLPPRLRIADAAGGVRLLDYQMVQGPEGWQINAVQILRVPGAGG